MTEGVSTYTWDRVEEGPSMEKGESGKALGKRDVCAELGASRKSSWADPSQGIDIPVHWHRLGSGKLSGHAGAKLEEVERAVGMRLGKRGEVW